MNDYSRIGGMKILVSPFALETTKERLFPESRHRSRRILKKLIRRHGGEFRMRPALWMFPDRNTVLCHPALYDKIKEAIDGYR